MCQCSYINRWSLHLSHLQLYSDVLLFISDVVLDKRSTNQPTPAGFLYNISFELFMLRIWQPTAEQAGITNVLCHYIIACLSGMIQLTDSCFASRVHALTMPTSRKMGRRTSQRFFCGPGRLMELLLVSFYMSAMMDEQLPRGSNS